MNFSSLGRNFKLKFELSQNFQLQSFELTRFYCNKKRGQKDIPSLSHYDCSATLFCVEQN
jgi:hypothetical protein